MARHHHADSDSGSNNPAELPDDSPAELPDDSQAGSSGDAPEELSDEHSEHPDGGDPVLQPATGGSDADGGSDTDGGSEQPILVLTTVAVPYGNRLTTYDGAGNGIIWQVPAELSAKVATGGMPRREAGEGCTAQCLVVDQSTLELRGIEDDSWPATMVDDDSLPVPPGEFQARLQQLLTSAARRGESVVFARAGLAEMQPPCVRATAVLDEDGETWLSVLEAFPPFLEGPWQDAELDEGCSIKTAMLDGETLAGGSVLMLLVTQSFTPGPDQIGLFFEQAPDGPWPG